jgi:hypothetical protein
MSEFEAVKCPFCGEDDFDKIGLKLHLTLWCDAYRDTELPKSTCAPEPRVEAQPKR